MTTYELTVDHVEGLVMETTTPSGHHLTMDSQAEPGGAGPTPLELLLASCAACSLIDVAHILDKKRLDFHDLKVTIEGERRDEQPRFFTELTLAYEVSGEVSEKALDQACQLSVDKYCSVLATVRQAPPVAWTSQVR